MPHTNEPSLAPLNRLVGAWTTEATHPSLPGVIVHGSTVIEWLEGERFLIYRARTDHADFPDAISIIGSTERDRAENGSRRIDPSAAGQVQLNMHYYDSRGVFRIYDLSVDEAAWRLNRESPGWDQRFTGVFEDGGNTIVGLWQLRQDGVRWNDDVRITYRRRG